MAEVLPSCRQNKIS